jgi:hypothetical protein
MHLSLPCTCLCPCLQPIPIYCHNLIPPPMHPFTSLFCQQFCNQTICHTAPFFCIHHHDYTTYHSQPTLSTHRPAGANNHTNNNTNFMTNASLWSTNTLRAVAVLATKRAASHTAGDLFPHAAARHLQAIARNSPHGGSQHFFNRQYRGLSNMQAAVNRLQSNAAPAGMVHRWKNLVILSATSIGAAAASTYGPWSFTDHSLGVTSHDCMTYISRLPLNIPSSFHGPYIPPIFRAALLSHTMPAVHATYPFCIPCGLPLCKDESEIFHTLNTESFGFLSHFTDSFQDLVLHFHPILAGGSVLRAVLEDGGNWPSTYDFDIFFLYTSAYQGSYGTYAIAMLCTHILSAVLSWVRARKHRKIIAVKLSAYAMTYDLKAEKDKTITMQFILRSYVSVSHILQSFDLSCCAIALDLMAPLASRRVVLTHACAAALYTRVVFFDFRAAPSRLAKYALRGFTLIDVSGNLHSTTLRAKRLIQKRRYPPKSNAYVLVLSSHHDQHPLTGENVLILTHAALGIWYMNDGLHWATEIPVTSRRFLTRDNSG